MTPVLIGIIGFSLLFFLLAFGLPIGFCMGIIGFLGFFALVALPAALTKLAIVPFEVITSYSLATLPLFLLMAQIAFVSGISKDLYDLAAKWLGHKPGGMAIATIGGCAGFAAISASSLATAATMGLVALPEMKKHKYSDQLATGCVAAGGTIGSLIPPSGMLIIYGVLTGTSISKLFMAGLIPGILQALFYVITVYLICSLKPDMGPRGPKYTLRERISAFKCCGDLLAIVIIVLGGLLFGLFTPTEAGAVGACSSLLVATIRRRLTLKKFIEALGETLRVTGMIYGILIGAFIFNYFVAVTTIPTQLAAYANQLNVSPLAILGVILVLYLFLGCFLDASAMQTLTIPVFFPVIISLGFSPIWFGIVLQRALEMALISPPIGMNVYVLKGVAPDVPMTAIFKGTIPFLTADVFHVALIIFIPQIVLFLPNFMS